MFIVKITWHRRFNMHIVSETTFEGALLEWAIEMEQSTYKIFLRINDFKVQLPCPYIARQSAFLSFVQHQPWRMLQCLSERELQRLLRITEK